MVQSKYIWARDLAQFDVNDEALEKFEKFDTFNEALQDAIDLFHEIICDNVTNYMKEHGITIYIAELVYDDLTQQKYFYQILTGIEEDDYLFEIGKKDGAIYPNLTNVYQYSDGMIWKLTDMEVDTWKYYYKWLIQQQENKIFILLQKALDLIKHLWYNTIRL